MTAERGCSRLEALAEVGDNPLQVLRKMGIEDRVPEKWAKVLRREPCVYCGERKPIDEMTVDHIEARAVTRRKAGPTNGAPACFACNQDKGDDSLLEFLVRRSPRQAPDHLEVSVDRSARASAHALLGTCPPASWWRVVAERVASRTLRSRAVKRQRGAELAWWVVPVRSVDGVELDLLIRARYDGRSVQFLRLRVMRPQPGQERRR